MRRVKLVAADIDGTLTISRDTYLLDLDAIKMIRVLEENDIRVSLVSGNSILIVAGLARYLGAKGPSIGENGCIVYYRGGIHRLCSSETRQAAELVKEELGLTPSWQNPYREYDLAFVKKDSSKEELRKLVTQASQILERHGYRNLKVVSSGYALHVMPREADKGQGLLYACKLLGISPSEVVAIGDSETDLELFEKAGISVAVSNADEKAKEKADIVLSKPSGKGFVELAELILSGKI